MQQFSTWLYSIQPSFPGRVRCITRTAFFLMGLFCRSLTFVTQQKSKSCFMNKTYIMVIDHHSTRLFNDLSATI